MDRSAVVLTAILLTALGGVASAQVRGVILDGQGASATGALVEAWVDGERQAATITDERGRFALVALGATGGMLLVRHIGHYPLRIMLSAVHGGVIRLTSLPVQLDALVVQGSGQCPERSSPEALAVYQRSRARYDAAQTRRGVRGTGLQWRGRVEARRFGWIDTTQLSPFLVYGGTRGEIARQHFYAAPPIMGVSGISDRWDYRRLESSSSWHWVDSSFAAWNALELRGTGSPWVVGFCSRRGRVPYVQGELVISNDYTLESASWRFVVPGDQELAGGDAWFAPISADGSPLFVASGRLWRRVGDRFDVEWTEYRSWQVCPEGVCPPRPER